MDNPRLIDANALMARFFRKERLVQGAASAAYRDAQKTVVAAPTVSLWPEWRDPDKDPPKVETEVLILYRNDIDGYGITTAHYEDGSIFLQDSEWYWENLPDWGAYDEERDDYKIPKGWWEYRHFNPDEVYNNQIDRPVVGWMPLPPKEGMQHDPHMDT